MSKAKGGTGLNLAVVYGPLLVFFIAHKLGGIFAGTAAFMAAIAVAVAVSRIWLGRVAPMLWLSAILVIGFGGVTIWLHDPKFIQLKPTIIYTLLSGLLFAGLAKGRPLLKYVLEAGYDGLSDRGWMILTRNWAFFFAGMAVFNEVLRASVSLDLWLTIKVWGLTVLTFVFALANMPVLLKHGLGDGEPVVVPPAD